MSEQVRQGVVAALAFAVAWLAIGLVLRQEVAAGDLLGAVLGGIVFFVFAVRRGGRRDG